jgi:protein-export membrane protein SecD
MSRSWYWKVFGVVMLAVIASLYLIPSVVRQRVRVEEPQVDADGNKVLNDKGEPVKRIVINDEPNLPFCGTKEELELFEKSKSEGGSVKKPPSFPFCYPNIFKKYIVLGLDLQGGVLLQYGVDINAALQSKANLYSDDITKRLGEYFTEQGLDVTPKVKPTSDGAIITTEPASEVSKIPGSFFDQFTTYDANSQTSTNIAVFKIVSQNNGEMQVQFTSEYQSYLERYAVDQGIQTINQRIDKLAVKEPEVRKGSSDSIVIQLPGLSEADFGQTQQIIEQTAQLQFKLVDDDPQSMTTLDQLSQRIPKGSPVTFERQGVGRDVPSSEIYLKASKKEALVSVINELTNFAEEAKDQTGRIYYKTLEDFRKVLPSAKELRFNDVRKETLRVTFAAPTDPQVVKDAIDKYLLQRKSDPANATSSLIATDFTLQTETALPVEEGQQQTVFVIAKRLRIPEDHDLLLNKETETDAQGAIKEEYWRTYWLLRKTELTGESLTDAQVSFDENRRSVVSFTMNSEGSVKLAKLSKENINKRFAIVLDNEVKSAPFFQSEIPNGRGQITLGDAKNPSAMLKEAQSLAIVLQAGALPAPLTRQFVTQVGPQLGQDAVDKGFLATTVGAALVFLFMALYYKRAGLIADVALALNLLLLLGIMAAIGATMTLPGIAGILLTIGTAVDSNILIFERIREELRGGKTPRQAIDAGYNNALRAIIDANSTNMISALVLAWYGSGPVKGFAITLMIGLVTSVFTSTFVTRLVFQYLAQRSKLERLSI